MDMEEKKFKTIYFNRGSIFVGLGLLGGQNICMEIKYPVPLKSHVL